MFGAGHLCDVFNDPGGAIRWKLEAVQEVEADVVTFCGVDNTCAPSDCCFPLDTNFAVCVKN